MQKEAEGDGALYTDSPTRSSLFVQTLRWRSGSGHIGLLVANFKRIVTRGFGADETHHVVLMEYF
jgi:hypothetical protein